jgi:hypothetical protein
MSDVLESLEQNTLERWRASPAEFIESYLVHPETGKPYRLYPAEKQFIEFMFQLDPDGHPVHTDLIYSGGKKSARGNSPHCCCCRHCCCLVGPMRKHLCVRMI